MIAAAQWRETRIPTKFGPVTLGVGELLIAERELAEDFGLHRNTLRALLQRMLDEGIIERFLDRCPHRAGTIIRIVNYAVYQGLGHPSEPKEDRSWTTNGTEEGPKEDQEQ
nr:GntR family transcriptional regulator [Azospirillum soli]